MTAPLLYGLRAARIVLFDSEGHTERITLQLSDAMGLEIAVSPEGIVNQLGDGTAYRKNWTPRSVRLSLKIKWAVSMPTETLRGAYTETPDGGGGWMGATTIENAEAVRRVLSSAMVYPCLVLPHLDSTDQSFYAQPSESSLYDLSDIRRIVHGPQHLEIIACSVGPLTDWEI